jgi:acyl dehydratase
LNALHHEEIEVGLAYDTPGITIAEHQGLHFADLVGGFYDLHVDDEYVRSIGYGGRVAHGSWASLWLMS